MSLSAWVYARFSSVEQSKGHSLERQLSTARAYIALKGWQHNPAQEITDEGKSAYSGDNRVEGTALAVFEARAKTGEFRHVPTVLVVENMDRLTRQGYEDALSFCNGLLTSGVSIATTMDGGFLQSGQRIDLATVINLILKAELAFEESAKKSDRIRKAWDAKLDAAKAGDRLAMTPIVPSWLKVDRVTKDISVIPNRSAIVNEIYDAYLDGQSIPKILVMLNTRKEPTWGYRPVVKGWHGATVQKILANRAVLGEYRPSKDSHNGGKFVIGDYFPQVVDTEKFNRGGVALLAITCLLELPSAATAVHRCIVKTVARRVQQPSSSGMVKLRPTPLRTIAT
jgi:DNA invertase Pin-like site-specific DNA recombinase